MYASQLLYLFISCFHFLARKYSARIFSLFLLFSYLLLIFNILNSLFIYLFNKILIKISPFACLMWEPENKIRKKKKNRKHGTYYQEGFSKMEVKSLSRVQLFTTLWTVTHQAPPSMGFSRQEYWSGLPFPSPGDIPDPGMEPRCPALQADALTSELSGKPKMEVESAKFLFWLDSLG